MKYGVVYDRSGLCNKGLLVRVIDCWTDMTAAFARAEEITKMGYKATVVPYAIACGYATAFDRR